MEPIVFCQIDTECFVPVREICSVYSAPDFDDTTVVLKTGQKFRVPATADEVMRRINDAQWGDNEDGY